MLNLYIHYMTKKVFVKRRKKWNKDEPENTMCPSLTATFRRTRICVLTSTLTAATPAYPKNTDIPTSPTAKNPCKTRMTFEQKSSPRQRQHAPLRIAESLARFIALLTAQRIFTIKTRRINNQAAVSQDYLLGEAHFVRKRINGNLFVAYSYTEYAIPKTWWNCRPRTCRADF